MFPVTLPPPGGNGTTPIMLHTNINKKHVSNHGTYFSYPFPILGFMISSTTYITSISTNPTNPFGASSLGFRFLYHRAGNKMQRIKMIALTNITATVFVIERSSFTGIYSPDSFFSKTLPAYSPFSANANPFDANFNPSFSSAKSEERNTLKPALVYTITGSGIIIAFSPSPVICHS